MHRENVSVQQAAENWQRCLPEELPRAFYAYNREDRQSERVVTYRLPDREVLTKLTARAQELEHFQFVIHLGLRDRKPRRRIPGQPDFMLFVQLRGVDAGAEEEGYPLEWVPNSHFGKRNAANTESGRNAIPGAGAYLFTQAWRELPYRDLAEPFTASVRELGRRVKSYVHTVEVSQTIHASLLGEENNGLTIHLGVGGAVWDHPFAFRPVVEVSGRFSGADEPENGDMGEGSYYDFADPEPPKHQG